MAHNVDTPLCPALKPSIIPRLQPLPHLFGGWYKNRLQTQGGTRPSPPSGYGSHYPLCSLVWHRMHRGGGQKPPKNKPSTTAAAPPDNRKGNRFVVREGQIQRQFTRGGTNSSVRACVRETIKSNTHGVSAQKRTNNRALYRNRVKEGEGKGVVQRDSTEVTRARKQTREVHWDINSNNKTCLPLHAQSVCLDHVV